MKVVFLNFLSGLYNQKLHQVFHYFEIEIHVQEIGSFKFLFLEIILAQQNLQVVDFLR